MKRYVETRTPEVPKHADAHAWGWDPHRDRAPQDGASPSVPAFGFGQQSRRRNRRRREQCVGVCALNGRTGFPRVADDWTEGSRGPWIE